MTEEQQLRLQAFLDSELTEKEARETAAWVARDGEAANLVRELRQTRQALADFEPSLRLPESREFFWARIERDIKRLEPVPARRARASFLDVLRRFLAPAGAVAALVIIGLFAGQQSGLFKPAYRVESETALSDPGTFTYHDYANGTTLVWLDYPAER
jgi:anti-sigma factor RsiW